MIKSYHISLKGDKMGKLIELLPLLIPLIIIQLSLQVYCLIDILKRDNFKYGNRLIWIIVVFAFNILGPVVYLIIARKD